MDEQEAIQRLKRGDIGGLEVLVRQYQLRAIRSAYLVVGDRSLAEDIVQTAFVRVFERIAQFDTQRSFGPWFLRMVVNDAIKAVQRHERTTPLHGCDADDVSIEMLPAREPALDEWVAQVECRQAVAAALRRLSPEQRAVIVLRYYLNMSEADMADNLDTPQGTIKWRLHSARQRLRTLLHQWRPSTVETRRKTS